MPGRRRSRRDASDGDNDNEFAYDSDAPRSRTRRRRNKEQDAGSARTPRVARRSEANEADVTILDGSNDGSAQTNGSAGREAGDEIARMAKRLVRMALAGEQARNPLRRTTVNEKILEASHRRDFLYVFGESQRLLMSTLGMKLVELPNRTVPVRGTKKRGRLVKPPPSSSTKSYILTSNLPEPFRKLDVLKPKSQGDAVYNGIVTTVCSVILLSGGQITSAGLMKHLRTLGIDKETPLGGQPTDEVLKLMVKHLYLEREKEDDAMGIDTGDSVWTYSIGPRAKVELTEDAVVDFAISVYGNHANDNLRERLKKALKEAKDALEDQKHVGDVTGELEAKLPSISAKKKPGKPRSKKARMAALEQDDNSAEEEDEEDEEEEAEEGSDEDEEEDEEVSSSGDEGSGSE
ncbi:MAGE family-domain-containing protein [Lipomyces tetrasporus]|uniref:MAGE family-domain-containing protein n=1 Tax=Lipomyces tetrasporus TaxID=54092 RepID=A0AAD7QPR4_9ASCO|nr:MAGE family-domain-containing protein [Lipomyces tetrasporus]KAJ8099155.1 MAGE family-domain-containing protein [Lipomyces tetrasporus]